MWERLIFALLLETWSRKPLVSGQLPVQLQSLGGEPLFGEEPDLKPQQTTPFSCGASVKQSRCEFIQQERRWGGSDMLKGTYVQRPDNWGFFSRRTSTRCTRAKSVKPFLELPSVRGVFCSDAGTLFYNQLMIVRCGCVNLLNYRLTATEFLLKRKKAWFPHLENKKQAPFVLFEWLQLRLKRRHEGGELLIHYERGSPEDFNSHSYTNNTADKI